MEIKKFEQLKSTFENVEFSERYRVINKFLSVFSYFGHGASVVIGFYFIYSVLMSAAGSHLPPGYAPSVIGGISVTFLVLFELLKRYLFNQASFEMVRARVAQWTASTVALLVFSSVVVGVSVYFGLSGAAMFSEDGSAAKTELRSGIKAARDSVGEIYNAKIASAELLLKEASERRSAAYERYRAAEGQLSSADDVRAARAAVSREEAALKRMTAEQAQRSAEVDTLRVQLDRAQQSAEKAASSVASVEVGKSESNQTKFVFIVAFVETLILIGIWFSNFYDWRSYTEGKLLMQRDPKLQTWKNYSMLLSFAYKEGKIGPGDLLISSAKVHEMSKIEGLSVSENYVKQFFTILRHLDAWEQTNDKKMRCKIEYAAAKEAIKNRLKVKE